jgi:hypothetical protein
LDTAVIVYFAAFASAAALSLPSLTREFFSRAIGGLFCCVLIGVIGLRYASVDYFTYQDIYNNVNSLSGLTWLGYPVGVLATVEPGFALLILLEKLFIGNFSAFLLLFAAVSVAIKYYAFRTLSPFVLLSILIYLGDTYFSKDLGQIRNAMASALVLVSLVFIHRRQFGYFAALVLLASSIHVVALIALPLYVIVPLVGRYLLLLMLLCSVAIALAGGIGSIVTEVARALGFDESARILRYADSQYVTGIGLFGGTFIVHCVMSFGLLAFYRPLVRVWAYNESLIPVYVYGTALMFAFLDYGIVAGRIREMLCVPAITVLLPSTILLMKGNGRLVPYLFIVAYSLAWFIMLADDMAPYRNVLFHA